MSNEKTKTYSDGIREAWDTAYRMLDMLDTLEDGRDDE